MSKGHNPFYYFMLEFKEKQGRNFKSMKDVCDAAGPHWTKMSKAQKEKYELMSKAAKGALRGSKLNCDNQPVDEVESMERQEISMKQQMKDDIQGTLTIAKRTKTLDTHMFYIVHVNSFCQHEHTKVYSPGEIAIVGFSLRDGVLSENIYHAMIKPGALPLGYASMAQIHSSETHQIEVPLSGSSEDNQEEVFNSIYEFLSSKKRDNSNCLPTLYAADRDLPMVNSVFDMWCSDFEADRKSFQIYNLQCMFRILRNMVAGTDECWASDTMSYQEIEKDVYSYTYEIACDYHQQVDALVFCSRSIVIRYAYVICDNCCRDANIDMIPGCHVPMIANLPGKTEWETKPSKKSTYSKNSSDGSIRDDTTDSVISFGKSSTGWGETSSMTSSSFPELRKPVGNNAMSGNSFFGKNSSQNRNASGSYAGATSMRTGGTRPGTADPGYNICEDFGNLNSQDSFDNHFPAIGAGGRARNFLRGGGRGNPFKKPPPAS